MRSATPSIWRASTSYRRFSALRSPRAHAASAASWSNAGTAGTVGGIDVRRATGRSEAGRLRKARMLADRPEPAAPRGPYIAAQKM